VFRREVDGETFRFSVYGLWGSGNVVTERDLLPASTNNAYTMWDGHALFGPPERAEIVVERVPALVADLPLSEFLDRYGWLAEDCAVWEGEEELGLACGETCAHVAELCDAYDIELCATECAEWPRSITDCLLGTDTCPDNEACNLPEWEAWQAE
jgi:hypothetical protein